MHIPEFWAEAWGSLDVNKGSKRVRRFGWSDVSVADAQRHAESRLQQMLEDFRAQRSARPLLREPMLAYGLTGVPIREEIVQRGDGFVITRNSYGALCLNTENVLFADIDNGEGLAVPLLWALVVALGGAWGAALFTPSGGAQLLVGGLLGGLVAVLNKNFFAKSERVSMRNLKRIRKLCEKNPLWRVRVYRTPAGLRLLALHKMFSAESPEVADFFRLTRCDPLFARLCRSQLCFRARVSPKPWRIGVSVPTKPRWPYPFRSEHKPYRDAWARSYDAKSAGFSSCHFVEELGKGGVVPGAAAIRDVHDRMARALEKYTLA